MIGAIMSAINLTCEAKTWKTWLDYILKKQKQYNFKKVALYHSRGNLLAATSGFRLSENDIKMLQNVLKSNTDLRPETIFLDDVTYVIKSVTSSQFVAFNGSRYLIVSRSKSIVIVTCVKYKAKSEEAAEFLKKIVSHLVKQNH